MCPSVKLTGKEKHHTLLANVSTAGRNRSLREPVAGLP